MPMMSSSSLIFSLFFFNDTATTEIYTLSLHDALPISRELRVGGRLLRQIERTRPRASCALRAASGRLDLLDTPEPFVDRDRKSTRLNSSHTVISYAVFCLKKKKTKKPTSIR